MPPHPAPSHRAVLALAAATLLGGLAPAVPAQVYKCTDASGHRSFSDRPCPSDAESEVLELATGAAGGFNSVRLMRRLLEIARHGDLGDRRRIERGLGIGIREPTPDALWRGYVVETVPEGYDVLSIQYVGPIGLDPRKAELSLTIAVDATRVCIAPELATRDLGEPARSETTSGNAPDGTVLTNVRRWFEFPARNAAKLELLVGAGVIGGATCVDQLVLSEKRGP